MYMTNFLNFLSFFYFFSSFIVLVLCVKGYFKLMAKIEEIELVVKTFINYASVILLEETKKTAEERIE